MHSQILPACVLCQVLGGCGTPLSLPRSQDAPPRDAPGDTELVVEPGDAPAGDPALSCAADGPVTVASDVYRLLFGCGRPVMSEGSGICVTLMSSVEGVIVDIDLEVVPDGFGSAAEVADISECLDADVVGLCAFGLRHPEHHDCIYGA